MSAGEPGAKLLLPDLSESTIAGDPLRQFESWFADALAANLPLPEAMALATSTPDGRPSARMVLLRGFDERGFVFYTNYDSRKGLELASNPQAALVFYWAALERQIRIDGRVEKVSPHEADSYFQNRAWGSRLAAWVSPQSQVIPDRQWLDRRMQELEAKYHDQTVPRPPYWGGYRVVPHMIEFWQGRPNRLHNRFRYLLREDGSWLVERLAP